MTERDKGLLIAAREARRRAAEENMLGNAKDLKSDGRGDKHYRHARLYEDFAEWCEYEANTYIGASRLLVEP